MKLWFSKSITIDITAVNE